MVAFLAGNERQKFRSSQIGDNCEPSSHRGHRNSKHTVPHMVLTRSCQSLITFKYVIELDDSANTSLSRVDPGARVRVSKRLIEPLREPVYTRL